MGIAYAFCHQPQRRQMDWFQAIFGYISCIVVMLNHQTKGTESTPFLIVCRVAAELSIAAVIAWCNMTVDWSLRTRQWQPELRRRTEVLFRRLKVRTFGLQFDVWTFGLWRNLFLRHRANWRRIRKMDQSETVKIISVEIINFKKLKPGIVEWKYEAATHFDALDGPHCKSEWGQMRFSLGL